MTPQAIGLTTLPPEAAVRDAGDSEYVWRFGVVVFDESRWELRVGGSVVEIEPKPLEMLGQLLRHGGEVVTKDELLAFLWPGVIVVDKALTNAVSKLRRAIGDAEQKVIVTVHRIGYRFTAPASRKAVATADIAKMQRFRPGETMPGRPQWRFERLLANAEGSDVWLALHEKTREQRVFKFAASGHRLTALKREATLSRVLMELLGPHPAIIRLHEWNFEEPPFFLECEYGGLNWLDWAQTGELLRLSQSQRIALVLQAVRAVAAAHGVGVLHKDLKPSNLLIAPALGGGWQVRLADFGCGHLLDPQQLEMLGVTRFNLTQPAPGDAQSGTLHYMPPEILAGHLPMPSADVYALGILLYQTLVGDLRKPLATGWEHDIDDPLLRADIAAATHGDPARRLQSALELTARLENLVPRAAAAAAQSKAEERAAGLQRELDLTRARRPWAIGLAISVVVGVLIGSVYLQRSLKSERAARGARVVADAERQRAEVINGFLVSDLLSAADPVLTGRSDVTVIEAVRRSSADVDQRLAGQPQVAAIVHVTAARAFSHVGAYAEAAEQYAKAADLFRKLGSALAGEAVAAEVMGVVSLIDDGQITAATARLQQTEATLSGPGYDSPEIHKLLYFVRGKLAIQAGDYPAARKFDEQALSAASEPRDDTELPQESRELLALIRKDYAYTLEQTGASEQAVGVMRERLAADQAALGADHTQVLIDKLELAEAMDTQAEPDPQGKALVEEILPGLDRALGPSNVYKERALDELGAWAMKQRDWPRAVEVFTQAHDIAVQLHGTQHQHTLAEAFNLGYVLERAGRHEPARVLLRDALQTVQTKLGRSTPLAQITAYTLANADLAVGRPAEARVAAHGLDAAALGSVEPDNDWPARLQLLSAETAFAEDAGEAPRRQLAAALEAVKTSRDDDHQDLYQQGAALLARSGRSAAR